MARDDQTVRYKNAYARLLRLYPRSYRTQFAEPMQQMFADLCNERMQAGEEMSIFILSTYINTFVSIVRERANYTYKNISENRTKIFIGVGGLSLVAIAPVVNVLLNNRPAQSISPFSYFEQAQTLSKGKKEACLPNNQQAVDAIKNYDDVIDHDGNQSSKFDITASTGIIDIPATTHYEITKNTYQDGIAKGTIAYENDYGTYNYVIERQSDTDQRQLESMIACKK